MKTEIKNNIIDFIENGFKNIPPEAVERLTLDEGYRKQPYRCSENRLTIGIGKMIDPDIGGGIEEDEATILLIYEMYKINKLLNHQFKWYNGLNNERKSAIINMVYNLGLSKFLQFKKTIQYLSEYRFIEASEEMLDSKWAVQVGPRSERLSKIIRQGSYNI